MAITEPKTFTLVPRKGRGLVTAYSPSNMGELSDSFQAFFHLFTREQAWQPRPSDSTQVFGSFPAAEFRNVHVFNQITDDAGTVSSELLSQLGNLLVSSVHGTIASFLAPYEIFYETVKNRVFWAGAGNPSIVYDSTVAATWGAAGPLGNLTYVGFSATSASSMVAAGTCTVNHTITVTWASGTDFTTPVPSLVGKTMVINGQKYTIDSVTDNHHLKLTVAIDATVLPDGTYNFVICYGNRSWSQAPKYAYAYYNPTTGHCTNGSPVLTLSESNMSNVAVCLSGIATNATLNTYGYTKIILFRTLTDGAELAGLFLNPLDPVTDGAGFLPNSGGPLTYTDNDGTDYNWGTLVGPAPMPITNDPAPEMRFIAYWQGRFWGVEAGRQYRLRFSGDTAEVALGVPEECWPAGNFRDITAQSDGYITSVKVVGQTLLVGTLRALFYVTGSGQGDFQLVRLSSRGCGVNQYAIDEHPGDSSTDTASAVYVSRDKILWRQFEGGRIEDIGSSIQNKLDAVLSLANTRKPFMVKVFRVRKLWLLALGILADNSGGIDRYDFYFYDFDQQAWYDWGFARGNTGAGYRANSFSWTPFLSTTGDAQSFFGIDTPNPTYVTLFDGGVLNLPYAMNTQPLDMGDRLASKSIEAFWLWVNDNTIPGWGVAARYEQKGSYQDFAFINVASSPRNPGTIGMCFVPQTPTDWHAIELAITIPPTGKLYRMDGKVTMASTAPTP